MSTLHGGRNAVIIQGDEDALRSAKERSAEILQRLRDSEDESSIPNYMDELTSVDSSIE